MLIITKYLDNNMRTHLVIFLGLLIISIICLLAYVYTKYINLIDSHNKKLSLLTPSNAILSSNNTNNNEIINIINNQYHATIKDQIKSSTIDEIKYNSPLSIHPRNHETIQKGMNYYDPTITKQDIHKQQDIDNKPTIIKQDINNKQQDLNDINKQQQQQQDLNDIICNDPLWCNIKIPNKSYFRFPQPPNDLYKWKMACKQAANGEQVLMKQIKKVFTNHLDFLDGDVMFRRYNLPADIFLDHNHDMSPLVDINIIKNNVDLNKLSIPKRGKYEWEKQNIGTVVPGNYKYYTIYISINIVRNNNAIYNTILLNTIVSHMNIYNYNA